MHLLAVWHVRGAVGPISLLLCAAARSCPQLQSVDASPAPASPSAASTAAPALRSACSCASAACGSSGDTQVIGGCAMSCLVHGHSSCHEPSFNTCPPILARRRLLWSCGRAGSGRRLRSCLQCVRKASRRACARSPSGVAARWRPSTSSSHATCSLMRLGSCSGDVR
jgi:hypothetical protein